MVKFKIRGNLRLLSHAETAKVFQRACVRAGIKIRYSQGFNPRQKLSLPLPRPVGVESDDDLLCLRVEALAESFDAERFKAGLSEQLPDGCELLSVRVAERKGSLQPEGATYVLPLIEDSRSNSRLRANIDRLLASETVNIQRKMNPKNRTRPNRAPGRDAGFRNVDVRPFLRSIELRDRDIVVECKIGSAGSIRVDEILKLLELDTDKLAAPIRRTNVQWQQA